ncbi:hypothetical protein [Candidatus Pollutiaquabacter sp.]|uniref:hypothetical protein n=1 Tax=Candidatus Pollutiaquabacter sp. TaxID=3416354 RepID=UPI003CAA7B77|nr:hypothetical protein [Bacteroidota bacterium]
MRGQTPVHPQPQGRLIERSQHAGAVERNNRRVRENTSTYSLRQQIIEHIFGTIKRQWGFDHILMKGLQKKRRRVRINLSHLQFSEGNEHHGPAEVEKVADQAAFFYFYG